MPREVQLGCSGLARCSRVQPHEASLQEQGQTRILPTQTEANNIILSIYSPFYDGVTLHFVLIPGHGDVVNWKWWQLTRWKQLSSNHVTD
jgi:hypothetical protein